MKILKKLLTVILTLSLVLLCSSIIIENVQGAVKVPKSVTGYMEPSLMLGNKSYGSVRLPISGMKSYENLRVVKMVPNNFVYFYGAYDNIPIFASSKPTSGTLYYKIDGKKKIYKTKITIKKYVNPVKSISVTGLKNGGSTDLASLTNKTYDTKEIKLSKIIKNPKVSVVAKSGWKIKRIADYQESTEYEKPVSKATAKIFKISRKLDNKDKSGYEFAITFVNTKNNHEVKLIYYINKDPRDMVPPDGVETIK